MAGADEVTWFEVMSRPRLDSNSVKNKEIEVKTIMLLLLQWNNSSWKKTLFTYKANCTIINLDTEQPIGNHLGYWMKNNYVINIDISMHQKLQIC